jgi:4-hydroxybenzoate polyprenyltransferase
MPKVPHSHPSNNTRSFFYRFYIYQKERFPFVGHGLLIAVFSFSAISFARLSAGKEGFISVERYVGVAIMCFLLFLLLRIADEFKDAEDDIRFRSHLPVPRGLIKLSELKALAIVILLFQLCLQLWLFPKMIALYLIVLFYLALMTKEFFIPEWLKKQPVAYVASHMLIIPLVDIYASGVDWFLEGSPAPFGLLYFFGVSFLNGVVLEVGRKIRVPEDESVGVNTYSAMLGKTKASLLWIAFLTFTLFLSLSAYQTVDSSVMGRNILFIAFGICVFPAVLFLFHSKRIWAKGIEITSALWTLIMYLTLGAIPMIKAEWF